MKKIFKILLKCMNVVCIIFLMLVLIIYGFRLAGIEPYIVVSGSMEPEIHVGSVCFVDTNYIYQDIQENDIIAYRSEQGHLVTHRVIGVTKQGLETKGDNNVLSDGITTTVQNFVGKTVFSIPRCGYVFQKLQTAQGKLLCVTWGICMLLLNRLMDMET